MESYKEVEKLYKDLECWGMSCSIDVKLCSPELIRSPEAISQYVRELCDLIKMKRFQNTVVVNFGEDEKVAGYSMVQLIETSLISGHFANLTNSAYIDIFSCKPYDPTEAADFTRKFFKGTYYKLELNYRK